MSFQAPGKNAICAATLKTTLPTPMLETPAAHDTAVHPDILKARADIEWLLSQRFLSASWCFSYDPDDGVLRWRNPVKHSSQKPGDPAGRLTQYGYINVSIGGRAYMAHRIIWLMVTKSWPKGQIDHKDGIRNNNRWDNLRDVSAAVNQQNRRKAQVGSHSSLLGVYPNVTSKKNPWKALIKPIDGKLRHLGSFPTPEAAHAAYLEAKRELHEGCMI
jgi:hypothetical protein